MNLTKYVACICEGAAEKAIMEILLDADKLIFKRDDLLEGELLRCRSGKNFEEQHLRKGFTEKIALHLPLLSCDGCPLLPFATDPPPLRQVR